MDRHHQPWQNLINLPIKGDTPITFSVKNVVHLPLTQGDSNRYGVTWLVSSIWHYKLLHTFLISHIVIYCLWYSTPVVHVLTDSYQEIKVSSNLSDLCKWMYHVPRGFSTRANPVFSVYNLLTRVRKRHSSIKLHFYSHDTKLSIYFALKNTATALQKLNQCLHNDKDWMSIVKLMLNPEIIEYILFGYK